MVRNILNESSISHMLTDSLFKSAKIIINNIQTIILYSNHSMKYYFHMAEILFGQSYIRSLGFKLQSGDDDDTHIGTILYKGKLPSASAPPMSNCLLNHHIKVHCIIIDYKYL